MKLIDLNRDGGIGANSLFVQLGDLNILVDSGLHPKKAGRLATPDHSAPPRQERGPDHHHALPPRPYRQPAAVDDGSTPRRR
jgi:hypothetical protein